jgi:transcriptional regulator with XRE-family HTH domain
MPWETVSLEEWAKELGIDIDELRKKNRLIETIVRIRNKLGLTQAQLATLVGVSQPRIAQIENRVKIGKVTFDVLFKILAALGHDYKIITKKVRRQDLERRAA